MTQRINENDTIQEEEAEEGKVDEENDDAEMDEKIMNNKVSDLFSRLKAIEDKHYAFRDSTEK